jgi:hypothetical protein
MADQTVVENFPKSSCTKAQVEEIRQDRLANGAKSCTLTEDSTNWILTTVWPGV